MARAALQPQARRPRGAVLLGGTAVPFTELEVENNAFFEADKAYVRLPASALPDGADLEWLCAQRELDIEVKTGFPPNPEKFAPAQLDTLFVGKVDNVGFSVDAGQVELRARDLTSLLIDTKTSDRYANLTASQLAERLAAKHGLTPVITATRTRIGSFYQIDQVRIQNKRTEWDLLTWAAREEDFIVYVRGRELVFASRNDGANPYVVEWRGAGDGVKQPIRSADATRLRFDRQMMLAKDVRVTVRSWSHRRGTAIVRRAGPSGEDIKEYVYSIPGLTPEQAQARATQIHAELTLHEMRVSIDGPADNTLTVADVIEVKGTGTAFDQLYYPEVVRRNLSQREGYRWTVEAKNRSREAQSS